MDHKINQEKFAYACIRNLDSNDGSTQSISHTLNVYLEAYELANQHNNPIIENEKTILEKNNKQIAQAFLDI